LLCGATALSSQTIEQCRMRFDRYLNFKGQLTPTVKFTDTSISLLSGSKSAITVYQSELNLLSAYMQISRPLNQQQVFQRKGNNRLSARMADSLTKLVNASGKANVSGGLKGKRIAIDPGHFAVNLKEAAAEQKYLNFGVANAQGKTDTVLVFESALTFATASIVKKLLEEKGATVLLTRQQENHTSFGCTYTHWLKQHKQRVLDSLVQAGSMSKATQNKLLKSNTHDFFWDFFRDFDLGNRVKLVNTYQPDATVIIHYNVDEKNTGWKKPTEKNFTMTFIGGAFGAGDIVRPDNKMDFLRLLLSPQLSLSDSLSGTTVANFNKYLGIPVAAAKDADYLANNCKPALFKGVYCRNLVLCRKINSPLVYGEALYQDNASECFELMKRNLDVAGVKTNARVAAAARAYFEALQVFFE